jgi:hypothetical protein
VRRELSVEALGGFLYVWRAQDLVLVEIHIDHTGAVSVILEGDAGTLRARRDIEPGERGHPELALGPFRKDAGTIHVRVETDGRVVAEETIGWHELPGGS